MAKRGRVIDEVFMTNEFNREFRLLINGELVSGDTTSDVTNPSTEKKIAVYPCASDSQLGLAVAAAKNSFDAWAAKPIEERRTYVVTLIAALRSEQTNLIKLLTSEQGKPLSEAAAEFDMAMSFLEYFLTLELADLIIVDDGVLTTTQSYRPLGVTALITAWNYPLALAVAKLGPALLAGNSVILKPAPTTPLTSLMLGELCADIFPAGVVNVLSDRNNIGPLLASHPDVTRISFTGSTPTGQHVMSSAAIGLKRITLELGGNDPAIVLDDVNVAKIAPKLYANAFANAGQVCRSIKRIYAHEAIYEELRQALCALAEDVVVGDGFDADVQMGPVQNRALFERLQTHLEDAKNRGATVFGGSIIERPGHFMRPGIVSNIDDDATLVKEEQFGPLLPILPFSSDQDAVNRANNSPFGLGASIWSADIDRAKELARKIVAGTVTINQHMEAGGAHVPLAGAKKSGIGVEFGSHALAEYAQLQVLSIASDNAV